MSDTNITIPEGADVQLLRAFPGVAGLCSWLKSLRKDTVVKIYAMDPEDHGNTLIAYKEGEKDYEFLEGEETNAVVTLAGGEYSASGDLAADILAVLAPPTPGDDEEQAAPASTGTEVKSAKLDPDPAAHLFDGGKGNVPQTAAAAAQGVQSSYGVLRVVTLVFWALQSSWGSNQVARGNLFKLKAVGSETHDEKGWNVFLLGLHSFEFFARRVRTSLPEETKALREKTPTRDQVVEFIALAGAKLYDAKTAKAAVELLEANPILWNYSPEVKSNVN